MKTLDRISKSFAGRVGTGAPETLVHNFGAAPVIVQLTPRDNTKTAVWSNPTVSSVDVTVENGAVYDVICWFDGGSGL